jgi:hypothetical protein
LIVTLFYLMYFGNQEIAKYAFSAQKNNDKFLKNF